MQRFSPLSDTCTCTFSFSRKTNNYQVFSTNLNLFNVFFCELHLILYKIPMKLEVRKGSHNEFVMIYFSTFPYGNHVCGYKLGWLN